MIHPQIYPPKVVDLIHQLIDFLQQESYTPDCFVELERIVSRIEEQLITQVVGSTCVVLRTDFWSSWAE